MTARRPSAAPPAPMSGVRMGDMPRPLPPARLPALPAPTPLPPRDAFVDTRRFRVVAPSAWNKIPRVVYFLCGMLFAVLIHYEATSSTTPAAPAPVVQAAPAPVAAPVRPRATTATASAGARPPAAVVAPIPTVDVSTLPIAPAPADHRWTRPRR